MSSSANDIQVEVVEEDAFQLIGCVMDLATLESELEDVKRNISLRFNRGSFVPLSVFRSSTGSVWVTDIAGGQWCEQQVEYRYLYPYLIATEEWRRSVKEKGRAIKRDSIAMRIGSNIHCKRELEIHNTPVPIRTDTKEDKMAVNLINMYTKLASIKGGSVGREIKVLGTPVHEMRSSNIVISGVIDQLQYCLKENSLVLLELKTRSTPSLPEETQKRSHYLQLMLYKALLDSWTQGLLDCHALLYQLGLKPSRKLTVGSMMYICDSGLANLLLDKLEDGPISLEELTGKVFRLISGLGLPPADTLLLQYVYQLGEVVLGVESVLYDEVWMMKEAAKNLEYWRGERSADGVDVEECWKCSSCQFVDVCVKKKRQVAERSPVKKWPPVFKRV